ncbi:complex I subunit 5 family protein [Clostridium ganghwense]|uniref:Proton-conducting transporter membrane subunit n=1 Tax=Clostridium ganghwense TaxID=312089 RepID=A0ABT4CSK5_9CLOT|nr:proton-conducting transporter membrane subunit [Clostridium ganghwense]MCY6372049.1 proton-conducting transporter membrane subunit [Clostridium ganghwense]
MIIKSFPLMVILILFVTSFTMPIINKKNIVKGISLTSMLGAFVLSIINLIYVLNHGKFLYTVGHFGAPFGIEFYIGNIEAIMGVLFTFVASMIIWYSIYSIDKDIKENRISLYYLLVNILIGALLGIVYTNDLFNSFVFIEVATLASCGIIVIKDKKENIKATIKYLIMSCLGSGLVLMGIAFLYSITGQLNIAYIHEALLKNYTNYPNVILITMALFTIGLGVKSAMFLLHTWLPDAHSSAPTSSSALLSSLVLKAFVLLLIKVLYRAFGIDIIRQFPVLNIIMVMGIVGMIMGSVFAIFQKEIKRVIAYSSVAQMGYIFLGIGLGTEAGVALAVFHMVGHAVTKSALFLSVGAMIEKTGHKKTYELKGIGKEMPFTLGLFFIGSLSMVGIPVLPGFVSKWYLALASIRADKPILVAFILISSLLNAVYYFPIIINGFFGEENLEGKVYKSKSKPLKELFPVIMLIAAMIGVGFVSRSIIKLIEAGIV